LDDEGLLLKMTLHQGPVRVLRRAIQYLKAFVIILQIPFLFLAFLILNTLKRIAPNLLFKFITSNVLSQINLTSWGNYKNIKSVDDLDFLFSVDIFKWKVEKGIEDALKTTNLGSEAPDFPVLDADSGTKTTLLSGSRPGRPHVLFFGSCS